MTSDKADRSAARTQLDFSIGKSRTSLKGLRKSEFDELLREVLHELDLRELRGFKSLREFLLSRSPTNVLSGPSNPLRVTAINTTLTLQGLSIELLPGRCPTYESHVVEICRGDVWQEVTYRRHETGEETTDWSVASGWGPRNGYVMRVRCSTLVLRRPNDHTGAEENLFVVDYTLKKIPHKDEYELVQAAISPIPLDMFREYFRGNYSKVAQYMIWEARTLASRTLEELRSQARAFEPNVDRLKRIGDAIME